MYEASSKGGSGGCPAAYISCVTILPSAWFPTWQDAQSEAFTIGILGESQFGEALDRLREKTIKGKKILVKHLAGPSDGRDCQIIFICVSEKERLPQILETLKRTRVLTVGETAGFAEEGGIANLIAERNRVRLETTTGLVSIKGTITVIMSAMDLNTAVFSSQVDRSFVAFSIRATLLPRKSYNCDTAFGHGGTKCNLPPELLL